MATVFETRLIGNIGKDAEVRSMDNGIVAINFPVAHNKNWKDKRTSELRTKTTWINCTIWKKEGANMKIVDYLKKGSLVDLIGTPFSKGYLHEDQTVRSEIRLNISKTNILRTTSKEDANVQESGNSANNSIEDFTLQGDDF
ncbi:MAG: single-stranded DNA-binding protein [Crocinitomicaceae bacterium]|tara:strand:+ start:376 stop:801 length:426 start_codon:yes stop_codon:yes gene_type:complete